MKKSLFDHIVDTTLVVGMVTALVKFFEYLGKQEKEYSLSSFEELVKEQKVVDELNAREITDWIKEVKKNTSEELTYILAYPTQEMIKKYRLKGFPDSIDKEHNMIFLAVRKNDYVPVKIQMISFATIDNKLVTELFSGEDYAVVEE